MIRTGDEWLGLGRDTRAGLVLCSDSDREVLATGERGDQAVVPHAGAAVLVSGGAGQVGFCSMNL